MRKAGSCLFSLMMVCFLCYLSGCNLMNNLPSKNANASNQNSALSPKGTATINGLFTPPQGKTMLILGQDLKSTWDYISTSSFPTPAGITTYLNLYSLDGLGPNDTDWGAGPINAASCVNGYPNSVLVMGIYMTEQYYPGGLTDIANGKYDTQIKTLATFIKSANRPAYIRIGYEFEGQWNGFTNPATYIAAYKHIVDTIRPVAPNFVSVWQAAASPIDTVLRGYHPNITDWYPGDNYVDWCGLSFFLPQDSRQFTYADEMLNFARSHQKPVMICESTPQGYNLSNMTKANISPVYDGTAGQNSQAKTADQIWSEWYAPYFNYIHQNADAIRAVAYINADWNSQSQWSPPYSQGYWGDTRVQENATIKQNWITEINSAFWLHGSSGLFSQLQNSQTTSSASTSAVSSSSKSSSSVSGGSGAGGPGQSFAPGNGKTLSLIGQNYLPEYQGYISGTGITPAGCSIYGEIYTGLLDTDSVSLLSWLQSNYPNAYVELAISVKDNPGAGGYGDFTTTPNAVYNAEVDIANGKWNTQIDIFANIIKAHPGMKFMVRLDYEVSMMMAANKTTTPYINILNKYNALGINIQTDPGAASELDCNAYKNMFNYMANRIRNTDGCANANFIYHPVRGYADCVNLYPGDTYCDSIGFSIFNNDICMNTLNSDGSVTANGSGPIDSNLSNCMAWAGPKKPIIICESAFQETGNGQSWTDFQTYLNKVFYVINTFGIQAFVYINSAWQSHSWTLPWGDSQVQDNAGVKSTWLSQISGSRYINYNGSIISPVSSSSSSSISSSSAASSSLAGVYPDR